MPRVSPTPLVLAQRALLGSAVAIIAFCGTLLPFPQPLAGHGIAAMLWSARLELLSVVLPSLLALVFCYWSLNRLGSGINHLRFSSEQLDQARSFVNQGWLTIVSSAVLLSLIVISFAAMVSHRHNNVFFLLLAANPLNYLRGTLRPPAPVRSGPHIDWKKVDPLHSDHWGDPPALQLQSIGESQAQHPA